MAVDASVKVIANPVRLSETPADYRITAPMLGEHTEAVLESVLGMNQTDIDALRKAGVI